MKRSGIAFAVLAASLVTGLLAARPPSLGNYRDFSSSEPPGYGSTRHALFYVVVNGTELNFTAAKYQGESRYVYLESNRSHIVHVRAEEVTWNYFLDTINASVTEYETSGKVCFERYDERYCGPGEVKVKGGTLDGSIEQGQELVIVIGGNATVEEYLGRELPPAYRPRRLPSRSV
ncbi:MAG: hypothetical protein ABEJ66_02185 [Candidatus Nanohaloarchaea archaeon]